MPSIATPNPVDYELIQNGHNGLLANGPIDWGGALVAVLCPGAASHMGASAREAVVDSFHADTITRKLVFDVSKLLF